MSLCFLSRGIDYRIAVNENGEQHDNPDEMWHIIHEFHQNGAGLTGSDIGLTLQTIPLDRKHLSTIYISLIPREISAFVMDIRLQKSAFFVLSNIRSRIGMFVESIFIVFFGIIGIVYTFFAVEANREYRRMYYAWGVFSFFLGVILLLQTQIFQMLTGKPEIYNAIKYSLGLIIVYPHALQIDYSARHPHRHYCYIIGVAVAVLLVFEAYSCFFLNVSMYRLFFVCALPLMLINVLMIVIYLARDILYIKKNREAVFSSVVLSIILLLSLITFADLTLYGTSKVHTAEWGRLMRSSYVVLVFFIMLTFIKLSRRRNKEAGMARMYRMQARTDALTGLANRVAYIEKKEKLVAELTQARSQGKTDFSFVIMSLDLNYLKKVNDFCGHDAGDEYIKNSSAMLIASVGERGEVYRLGGDEFMVLLFGDDPEQVYQRVVTSLQKNIDDFNSSAHRDILLSFAYGHSLCTSAGTMTMQESEHLADLNMYECKKRMKAERNL